MSIIETDTKTKSVSVWDEKIIHAREIGALLPNLLLLAPNGKYQKEGMRYTGASANQLMMEAVIYDIDSNGDIIPETEKSMGEPDFLSGEEINKANIVVGTKKLTWQEKHPPLQKSA